MSLSVRPVFPLNLFLCLHLSCCVMFLLLLLVLFFSWVVRCSSWLILSFSFLCFTLHRSQLVSNLCQDILQYNYNHSAALRGGAAERCKNNEAFPDTEVELQSRRVCLSLWRKLQLNPSDFPQQNSRISDKHWWVHDHIKTDCRKIWLNWLKTSIWLCYTFITIFYAI